MRYTVEVIELDRLPFLSTFGPALYLWASLIGLYTKKTFDE
jgi:hypothetical protein